MIRSTRDPGPSILAAVIPVCVVLAVVASWLYAAERPDEYVTEQTRQTLCADPDAPAAPTNCRETP